MIHEEGIELAGGKMLYKSYGKYCGNLTLICPAKKKPADFRLSERPEQARFFDGSVEVFPGEYRKNAKGTDIFEMDRTGHVLVVCDWGGAFSRTRGGGEVKMPDPVYYRRASSNGGGTGYTYFIFTVADFAAIGKNLTEEDF